MEVREEVSSGRRERREPLFIESVLLQDSVFPLLEKHVERMNRTVGEVFGLGILWTLAGLSAELEGLIPEHARRGRCKCRILYGPRIRQVEFLPYRPALIRSLQWVDVPAFDYHLKYADRRVLESLRAKRRGCDDVLIGRNGYITDTSYSNVVLWDGSDFYTPEHCLLAGVRRRYLIETGKVRVLPLQIGDLAAFERLYIINAMLGIEDDVSIAVSRVMR